MCMVMQIISYIWFFTHGVEAKQSMQSTNSGMSAEPEKKQAHTELEAACKLLSILHNLATSTSN